jgi:hypothetical protein
VRAVVALTFAAAAGALAASTVGTGRSAPARSVEAPNASGPQPAGDSDDIDGGGGFELDQQLISVNGGRTSVLWEQHNKRA